MLEKALVSVVALMMLCAACGSSPSDRASGCVQTRGHELVGPDGAALRLRGINLGNWLVPGARTRRAPSGRPGAIPTSRARTSGT